jgi:hypothetical protein
MATKVSVITNPGNRISIGKAAGISKLEQLMDVDASGKANNNVLVYDEASGKYIVKVLPLVDGGQY